MMTKAFIDAYLEASEEIEAEATKMLKRFKEIYLEEMGYPWPQWGGFLGIDYGDLHFGGEETWSYGGHQDWSWHLPIEYLYDPDWEEIVRSEYRKKAELIRQEDKKKADSIAQAERNQLLALRAKYPDVGTSLE